MINKIKKLITKLTRKHLLVIKVENVNTPPVIERTGFTSPSREQF